MKKTVTLILVALLGISTSWAYDFSAVAPSGQTLYYTITNTGSHTVSVTYPNENGYWEGYSQPAGALIIPDTVSCDGTTYTVTAIDTDAFWPCAGLTSVVIPNTVTTIGYGAFYQCSGLTSVTIPNSVTVIEEVAFAECHRLASVTIPNSVIEIGSNAFDFVKNVIYDGTAGNSPWGALTRNGYEEGELIYFDNTKTRLMGCMTSATSVAIPNSVTIIGDYAFSACSSLESVTIPNSVTSIGVGSFGSCSSLTNVSIPNSVTSIGTVSFAGCSSLTSITISNSVTSIGYRTFYGCGGLTSITIPNSVVSIEDEAFCECGSLANVVIPNSVTAIGGLAFWGCTSLTSVVIPNSVTSIGNGAFAGCSGLASASIGNSVTTIRRNTFSGCSNLAEVTIGSSVDTIEYLAFYGCISLSEITSNADVAPTIQFEDSTFAGVPNDIPVNIPCGSLASYESEWSYFTNFVECGAVGIGDVTKIAYEVLSEQGAVVVKDAVGERVRAFDIAGRLLYQGRIESDYWRYSVAKGGVYLLQVADQPAQKVVVVR